MKTKNVTVLYTKNMKKRLVKAAMRKARREAVANGFKVTSVVAFKKCNRYEYHKQYAL